MKSIPGQKKSTRYPRYPTINLTALKAIFFRIFRLRTSFHKDAVRLCSRIHPPVIYSFVENIPKEQGFLVTINHYARRGFNTAWIALSASAIIKREISWVMVDEWVFKGNPLAFILHPIMRFTLSSVNYVYGFLSMPTMLDDFSDSSKKAAAVRSIITFARSHPQAVIGIAPEGMDSPVGDVGFPQPGTGKLILYLNQLGFPILPVGVFEQDGQFIACFGESYDLDFDKSRGMNETDRIVRKVIRENIRKLIHQ